MTIEQVIKANELVSQIKELEQYKEIMEEHKNSNHFEFRQHYGKDSMKLLIEQKYNERFLFVLKEIISEKYAELQAM
jgi:hypothetical protein